MNSHLYSCAVAWIVLSSATLAAPENVLRSVADLNCKGVGFQSSPTDVTRLIPSANVNNSHPGNDEGVTTFEVWDDPIVDCILLRFSHQQLIEIQYLYFATKVERMGGADAITSLALQEYGQPTHKNSTTLRWDFPTIDRVVEVAESHNKWTQRIYHRSRCLAFDAYPVTTASPKTSSIFVAEGPDVPVSGYRPAATVASIPITIPPKVREIIELNARLDHPHDKAQQAYTIVEQSEAFEALAQLACPASFESQDFERLKAKIAKSHVADYSTQVHLLRQQITAHDALQSLEVPEGVPGGHFYGLKQSAARRFPNDYTTQLYIVRQGIDKQLSAYWHLVE